MIRTARWILLSLAFCTFFSAKVQAQTINSSSCSSSAVQAALNSVAADGTTVVIPACTATTWTTQVTYNQPFAVTIQGQTTCAGTPPSSCVDNTILSSALAASQTPYLVINAPAGKFIRLTGLTFTGNQPNNNVGAVLVSGQSNQVRIDHNHFNNVAATALGTTNVFGVIDHVVVDGTNNYEFWRPLQISYGGVGKDGDNSWANPSGLGGPNFMFLEDSTINGTGAQGVATNDCFSGGRYVVRHNTLNDTSVQGHTTGHAFDDRGCRTQEFYLNTLPTVAGGIIPFNAVDLESGTGVVWGNTASQYQHFITAHDKRVNNQTYTQSAPSGGWGYCGSGFNGTASNWDQNNPTATGYACIDQLGRGQGDLLQGLFPNKCNVNLNPACNIFTGQWPRQNYEPVYEWNDTWSCNSCGGFFITIYEAVIQQNRDIYLGNGASCSGSSCTSGVGVGLLSARPPNCTPFVGFWATDQNTLYQCSSTNAWTAYYTPYTYPHPLTQGPGTPPAPPTNLGAVVN